MKLLTLCGFLFLFLLCLNTFTAEGQKAKKGVCCSKLPKLDKKVHKGTYFKKTPMEKRKHCKLCPQRDPQIFTGPLPQLK